MQNNEYCKVIIDKISNNTHFILKFINNKNEIVSTRLVSKAKNKYKDLERAIKILSKENPSASSPCESAAEGDLK